MRFPALLVAAFLLAACSSSEPVAERAAATQEPVQVASPHQPPPPAAVPPARIPVHVDAVVAPAAPAVQAFADPLVAREGRAAGSALDRVALMTGGASWSANGGVGFAVDGATVAASGAAAGAHHAIPVVAGTIRVRAEVRAAGSGFTGIALGHGNLSGDFWKSAAVDFFIRPGGYGLMVGAKNLIAASDAKLLAGDGRDQVELLVDTVARTVTARLNGTAVIDKAAIPADVRIAGIDAAGFRFNEQVVAGGPRISAWQVDVASAATSGLVPVDHAMCFVEPGQAATLRWSSAVRGPGDAVPYAISDYTGIPVASGSAALAADGSVSFTRTFARGYYEVAFPEAGQTFGIVALEARRGPADPFFCMDAGLSWLETDPARRDALVRILARSGIAMARERLGLGSINPGPGIYEWDKAPRSFATLRATYATYGVPILEMLHGGAKQHELTKDAWYPTNFPQLAVSNVEQASHWGASWGAVEIENEPDLKPFPAEQYVAIAKAASYAHALAGSPVPLVTGVLATIPPGPYFDACAANGLLGDSDAVSFHSYDRAASVEPMIARYRAWLAKAGAADMPLWHSECGWPWVKGPDRAPRAQDADSAVEIAYKGVESLACGVARYFPFVYTHYEEGPRCFGMMGREATPMRSMAAYAMAARTLSGLRYVGDLTGLGGPVVRARVFAGATDAELVAVLYAGSPKDAAVAHLPLPVLRAAGADGRTLAISDGDLPLADGMAYVWLDATVAAGHMQGDTTAARLSAIARQPLVQHRRASPIVLQFLAAQTPARASSRRYLVSQETAAALPLRARIQNLSQEAITVHPALTLPGGKPVALDAVTVPAQGLIEIGWTVDASAALDIATTRMAVVSATVDRGTPPSPLAIPLVMEGTLEQHLARYPHQRVLPFTDLSRWKRNCAEHGTSRFSVVDGVWRMDDAFAPATGGWDYPKFTLDQRIDPTSENGFLIRARIARPNRGVAIMANPNQPDSFWCDDLFPADGAWHVVYVPFAELKPGPGGAGMQNSRLAPESWTTLALGMGGTSENTYELSHFLVVGGSGAE